MSTEPVQWEPPKPDFAKVCGMYNDLYYHTLLSIGDAAGVSREVIEAMYIGEQPVKRADAVAVLKAFSQHVGYPWTLDNTSVPTIPPDESENPV